ncbi:MAG: putative bifunctional diguanylate cyclase/phosphodiesterase [Caulobacterales bacterium]
MINAKGRLSTDVLALASVASIAAFVAILCVVAASYPGARPLLTVVITGLGAGGLILFRQLRKAASSLTTSEARAQYVATHDALTQLPNKALLIDRLQEAAKQARSFEGGAAIGVLCIGLDRFEEVVEVLGLAAGDDVALELAARLNAQCGERDTVARIGDDVFALLCSSANRESAQALAGRMLDVLCAPYAAAAGQAVITCSVGVGFLTRGLDNPAEALRQAQLALSNARRLGGGHHSVFDVSMDQALKSRKALEVELRHALAANALTMVYQPQVNAKGVMVGVEALMRWTSELSGEVSPANFVPLSETCGLGGVLGRFALRQAFADSKRWPGLKVAVNISAPQVRSGDLVATLNELLAESGCNPRNFELEITEGVLLADEAETYETLNAIRRLGFSISLDDFGTGYSSLSYLRRFPVDKIKIDRSFISHLGKRPESSAIVKAIIDLAEALELKVIAEGVETRAQADRLAELGCTHYQGYFFSRPVATRVIDEMLAGRTKLAA